MLYFIQCHLHPSLRQKAKFVSGLQGVYCAAVARQKSAAGARRALSLDVAGAFHTEVMRPAQDEMDRLFAQTDFQTPRAPVIGNTTGTPLTTADAIRAELADQLCGCVYWQQSVEYMAANGIERFVEIGPGAVLSGLAKRIAPGVETVAVGGLDALDALT